MSSARALDQFFTKPKVALDCWHLLLKHLPDTFENTFFVEPSAGACAFYSLMPAQRRAGFDLAPQSGGEPDCLREVQSADFMALDLQVVRKAAAERKVAVAGNPPFGKNSSLALKFLNRCAEFADVVGFVLPRTFSKVSTLNKVDPRLHLVFEKELDQDAFTFEGASYSVPCVFQVWERRKAQRQKKTLKTTHPDFVFCSRDDATFAMRRVGALAGKVIARTDPKFKEYAAASHYFIKAQQPEVERLIRDLDFTAVKHKTAGNPSVSKHELIELYEAQLKKEKRKKSRQQPAS